MIARWKEWSARIDELSLRERALVFVAAVVMIVMLVHTAALQPLLRLQRNYVDRIKQDESQLKSIREILLKNADPSKDDPLAAKRQRLRDLEGQLAQTQARLEQNRKGQITPEQLTALLRDMLGRNREVRMLALRVLPAGALASTPPTGGEAGKSAPSAGKPPATAQGPQFFRHAIEVEMTGGYLELLKYLEDVEGLSWKLAWSGIDLATTNHPEVRLRATLQIFSASPSLLEL